jgi:hypothetical protein
MSEKPVKDGLQIRDYQVEDFSSVRKIFKDGIGDNVWISFKSNWNGDRAGNEIVSK